MKDDWLIDICQNLNVLRESLLSKLERSGGRLCPVCNVSLKKEDRNQHLLLEHKVIIMPLVVKIIKKIGHPKARFFILFFFFYLKIFSSKNYLFSPTQGTKHWNNITALLNHASWGNLLIFKRGKGVMIFKEDIHPWLYLNISCILGCV